MNLSRTPKDIFFSRQLELEQKVLFAPILMIFFCTVPVNNKINHINQNRKNLRNEFAFISEHLPPPTSESFGTKIILTVMVNILSILSTKLIISQKLNIAKSFFSYVSEHCAYFWIKNTIHRY